MIMIVIYLGLTTIITENYWHVSHLLLNILLILWQMLSKLMYYYYYYYYIL